jgi:hypothetical protein
MDYVVVGKPVFRRRAGLFRYAPQIRIFEYLMDNLRFIEETDDFHLSLTMRIFQGIKLPDFLYALPPRRRRNPALADWRFERKYYQVAGESFS